MKPGPPMNGVSGMNVVIMYVAARPAASVSSAVLGIHCLLFSGLIILPPYSGVFLREAQRVGGPTHAPEIWHGRHFDLRLVRYGNRLTVGTNREPVVTWLVECGLEIDYDRPRFFLL
jgi:hypothetical protein